MVGVDGEERANREEQWGGGIMTADSVAGAGRDSRSWWGILSPF